MCKKIVVLGGGISGLTTAYYLKKFYSEKAQVVVLEQENRAGGWVRTECLEGELIEKGPRGFRPQGYGAATLCLVDELGMENELVGACPLAKKRLIITPDSSFFLPYNLASFLAFPLKKSLIASFCKDFLSSKKNHKDLSVEQFFSQHLTSDIIEKLIDPFFLGIYGTSIKKASAQSCFPSLFSKRSLFFSRSKDVPPFHQSQKKWTQHPLLSFKQGMSSLTDKLKEALQNELLLNHSVQGLEKTEKGLLIETDQGSFEADIVISTLPSRALFSCFPVAHKNFSLEFSSLRGVNLVIDKKSLPKKLESFGFLVNSRCQSPLLGCVFDSFTFPCRLVDPNKVVATLMLGGPRFSLISDLNSEGLKKIAIEAFEKHTHCNLKIINSETFEAKNALPIYPIGFQSFRDNFLRQTKRDFPNLFLSGSSFHRPAINDCIYEAKCLAQKVGVTLKATRSLCSNFELLDLAGKNTPKSLIK